MITKFVLNEILHRVGMSWIISSNKEMKYEINKNNHQDWLNKGPWYNTSICLKFYGSTFEYSIAHARTYRYDLMCSLVANNKIQPSYEDDESSIGDRSIPKFATSILLFATKEHMRLYRSVPVCVIKSSNILQCNFKQMDVLYQGPLLN